MEKITNGMPMSSLTKLLKEDAHMIVDIKTPDNTYSLHNTNQLIHFFDNSNLILESAEFSYDNSKFNGIVVLNARQKEY